MRVKGCCGASANEKSCAHGAQINFGDLTSYITYDLNESSFFRDMENLPLLLLTKLRCGHKK
jgi:hypothetical protein